MRRAAMCMALAIAGLCVVPGEAWAWSEATHAYIADHIGKQSGLRNYNEMYGAMAPDLFNTKQFSIINNEPLYKCIRKHTHGFAPESAEDFMAVWQQAAWGLKKNAAHGFISHNDVWGADAAAHWDGLTNLASLGWVMEKALELRDQLDAMQVWETLGIPVSVTPPADDDEELWTFPPAELLCQYLVMKAGDVIIKREDPLIGSKVALAALLRTPTFNGLLAHAISCGDEDFVREAELEFRQNTILLGLVLLQSEQQYLDAVTAQLVALAPSFLAAYNIPYDPAQEQYVGQVVATGLQMALTMIEGDYMTEINAIIANVEGAMASHGVSY